MDTKQPLTLFVVAILAASVFSVVGIASIPLQTASAQAVTIETSADALGGTFFGHGVLQVVIEDENADDDSDDDIDVTIEADGDTSDSDSFTINDTTDGSQRFEFFLVHEDSDFAGGAGIDGINPTPIMITFGPTGNLTTGGDLFDDVTFEIQYGNEDATIDYEEVEALLTLDRDEFGSTSIVYILIDDQDANLNPTDRDIFTLNDTQLNTLLFDIDGATFDVEAVGGLDFEETGDNTAVFEAEVNLDTTAADDIFDATEETVQMTLNDQANYDTTLLDSGGAAIEIEDGGINDSTDTSEFSFEITDSDGDVDDVNAPTFGTELKVVVRDNDQNIDSDDDDTIVDAFVVEVDAAGGDVEFVDLAETGDNTGVFEFDLANSELRITFLADGVLPTVNNTILELRAADIEEDLILSYLDPLDDDSLPSTVAEFTIAITTTPGQLSAPEEVGVTDEFTVTLNEPDLNDNPRTKDSYTIEMEETGPYPLLRGGVEFGDIYTIEIEHDGDVIDFGASGLSTTITETGINTGIFTFEIDMEDITDFGDDGAALEVSDGDEITINIDDFMADTADPDEDSVSITIGKPSVGLDFSRTTVPIPPEDGSATFLEVGEDVIIQLILVDPTLGTQSNVEEIVPFVIGDDEGEFTIEVDGDDVNDITVDEESGAVDSFFGTDADCDGGGLTDEAEIVTGVSLCEVMTVDDLDETGKATGVFEAEIAFTMDGVDPDDMSSSDWQDAEFTFTFFTDEGDEESAGFTFRGNDAILSSDQVSATTGTMIQLIVEDQDLNLDDDEMETFESNGVGGLLLVETEDETIEDIAGCPAIDDQDFEETSEDSGVFIAEFEVGDDIPVSCLDDDVVEQATEILITYDDEIDSTGGGGDELEFSVPVVSSTGSIQVSPTLVGPATTINILIVDMDLNEDSASTDDYESPDPFGDDFFVSFASSRNEVGEGSPDIEETGPNTGVFAFELELITDEDACADDDLSDDEFEATGGDTDSTIGACPGDLISIRYEDERTGSGSRATVSEIVEVSSWDPEVVFNQDSYSVGERITATIADADANRDSDISDTISDIRVTSTSDRVGEEFSALETGRDTGVFRLTFGTSAGTASGSISVRQGDDVTIRITDDFPADFAEEEEDKDFLFTVTIGGALGARATTVTPPAVQDVSGQPLDEINAGQQVVLTTTVINQNDQSQPFLALIEVRDSNDVTVYLAWQTGTLNPRGQSQVGLSFTPQDPGDLTFRTFVLDDLTTPVILSEVQESEFTVS